MARDDEAERPIIRALYRSVADLPQPWRWFLERRSSSALLTLCVYVPALSTVPLVGWLAAQIELAEERQKLAEQAQTIARQAETIVEQVEARAEVDAAAQAFLRAYAVASMAREFGGDAPAPDEDTFSQ